MTQISKSGNSKYNGAGLTWASRENASKDPVERTFGKTLYVIRMISTGLLRVCMFMAMMSKEAKKTECCYT